MNRSTFYSKPKIGKLIFLRYLQRNVTCFHQLLANKKASSITELALYRRRDSNPHARRHTHLKRARLPISPLRHFR